MHFGWNRYTAILFASSNAWENGVQLALSELGFFDRIKKHFRTLTRFLLAIWRRCYTSGTYEVPELELPSGQLTTQLRVTQRHRNAVPCTLCSCLADSETHNSSPEHKAGTFMTGYATMNGWVPKMNGMTLPCSQTSFFSWNRHPVLGLKTKRLSYQHGLYSHKKCTHLSSEENSVQKRLVTSFWPGRR